jgi:hypothetical protein
MNHIPHYMGLKMLCRLPEIRAAQARDKIELMRIGQINGRDI